MSQSACLHRFEDSSSVVLPSCFPWPFRYEASSASRLAAEAVSRHIDGDAALSEALGEGKMLGVLVVTDVAGCPGFLAAFSGNVGGRNRIDYFVPPIVDLLDPDGVYKEGEAAIMAVGARLAALRDDPAYAKARSELRRVVEASESAERESRRVMAASRDRRHARRAGATLTAAEEQALIAESQHERAEYKRMRRRHEAAVAACRRRVDEYETALRTLETERKQMSERLQERLFTMYRVENALGESDDLLHIFACERGCLPPAGAGECCAPKLLHYAYSHRLRPITMAEFWYERHPERGMRRHGEFYPSCHSKCLPIMRFMLRGLPLERVGEIAEPPRVIYRDDVMLAVDKPAGMLSVPGKDGTTSALEVVARSTGLDVLEVHRLDMATSGVLLMALTPEAQSDLRRQFEDRVVEKEYVAVLEGLLVSDAGEITLPLRPDSDDRPRQVVDETTGKRAVTRYHVVARDEVAATSRVIFMPLTGRTHQLRVHAAHPRGLNRPIVGDALYGHADRRMLLHARRLSLLHPITRRRMTIEAPTPF